MSNTPRTSHPICTFRKASIQDAISIRALATRAWQVAYRDILTPDFMGHELEREYSQTALAQQMNTLGHQFILLETPSRQLAGFVSYSLKGPVATIHKLYLDPLIKGKGYGAALMKQAESEIQTQTTCQILELRVNRHNPAVEFYKRQGYTITQEEDTLVGENFWRNDYVMQKTL